LRLIWRGQGKQQHVVEIFHFIDAGTSILLDSSAHQNSHAQTVARDAGAVLA
jgi:hypothetical protein